MVIESSKQAWHLTHFEVVRRAFDQASKAGKDSPYQLFLHAASWIENSVHCKRDAASVNETMGFLLKHIDVPKMKLYELQHLLDYSPLVGLILCLSLSLSLSRFVFGLAN